MACYFPTRNNELYDLSNAAYAVPSSLYLNWKDREKDLAFLMLLQDCVLLAWAVEAEALEPSNRKKKLSVALTGFILIVPTDF